MALKMAEPEKTQKQEYGNADDFVSIYSNSVRLMIGLWDFRFNFGEVTDATAELLKVSEKVRITMSPQHAKVFLQVFEKNLKRYEKKFGEIKLPVGIVAEADTDADEKS
jgi:hypothetical protein